MKFNTTKLQEKYAEELNKLGPQAFKLGSQEEFSKLNRWLYVLVREQKPEVVVENGVNRGQSTYCILKALESNRKEWVSKNNISPINKPPRNRLISFDSREKAEFPELRADWEYLKRKFQPSKPGNYIPHHLEYLWNFMEGDILDCGRQELEKVSGTVDLYVSNLYYSDNITKTNSEVIQIEDFLTPRQGVLAFSKQISSYIRGKFKDQKTDRLRRCDLHILGVD